MTTITPDIARDLLTRNTGNRNPKPRMIGQFARDMRAGRWDPDAADLKFSASGFLIDGQNRLMACVEANVPFSTLVRTGLNPRTKIYVDTGARRTAADALRMAGVTGSTGAIAAAVALRVRYSERIELYGRRRGWDYKSQILTHDEVLSYLEDHPAVNKFAPSAELMRKRVVAIPTSPILASLSWFAEVDESDTASFVSKLVEGDFGGAGDPLLALLGYAARLRSGRTGSPGARGRVAQEEHMMAFIKVWNALREGNALDRLAIGRHDKLETPL